MPSLIFYRQQRADGGTRMGIDADGITLAEDFQEGIGELDPAILWYIDLRCRGEFLPTDAEAALEWFRSHTGAFQAVLEEVADELRPDINSEALSFQRIFAGRLPAAEVEVAVSATRRTADRSVAEQLSHIARHWSELLDAISIHSRV